MSTFWNTKVGILFCAPNFYSKKVTFMSTFWNGIWILRRGKGENAVILRGEEGEGALDFGEVGKGRGCAGFERRTLSGSCGNVFD